MRELRGDRGTSMTEVMVVLAITALLAVPLMAVLGTTTRLDETQTSRVEARADLDWALTLIADDVRLGTPTLRPAVGARMHATLPLSVVDEAGVETLVHWRVGTGGLERITYDPTTLRERSRSIVVVNVAADPAVDPFVYRDADGDVLDPRTRAAATVVDCTTLVTVTLTAQASDRTVDASLDVAVRTRPPGGNGC